MSFSATKEVKETRKTRNCWWCGQIIDQGHRAFYKSWVWEGDFSTGYWHPECHHAEQEFHRLYPGEETYSGEFTRGRPDDEFGGPLFDENGKKWEAA